jgi:hypothetical protein
MGMTVNELIELLKTYPPHMLVAAEMYSEQYLVTPKDISVTRLCLPRPDGWVQNYRQDKESTEYVLFRGN